MDIRPSTNRIRILSAPFSQSCIDDLFQSITKKAREKSLIAKSEITSRIFFENVRHYLKGCVFSNIALILAKGE
jgi:hypothetical protein